MTSRWTLSARRPRLASSLATRSAPSVVDVGDEHMGAGGGEHAGDRLADARRRAGDERHLAVEREQLADRVVHGRSVLGVWSHA